MVTLLSIVFLAAIIGVFRPYIDKLNRKHFAAIAAATFVLIMVVAPKNDPVTKPTESASIDAPEKTAEPVRIAPTEEQKAEDKWSYDEVKDEMRGTTIRYASISSDNQVDLDFPYGIQTGRITIRKRPQDGLNIMFSVGKGQILCHSFSDSKIFVKFDNGPIRQFECTSSSDGSSETAFFISKNSVLSGLKKAKRTIIEAEFYQKGRQQFIFDTSGLEWK